MKTMIKTFFFRTFIVSLFLFFSSSAYGVTDVYLNVARKGMEKIKIAIPDFLPENDGVALFPDQKMFAKNAQVLRNDLYVTEYFTILWNTKVLNPLFASDHREKLTHYENWKDLGVDYFITGTYLLENSGKSVTYTFKLHSVKAKNVILAKRYRGSGKLLRLLAHKFSDDALLQLTGERGIATTKILYEGKEGGKKQVFVMDYDGYNSMKLSREGNISLSPSWSSDNRTVYYTTYRNDNPNLLGLDLLTGKRSWFSTKEGLNNALSFSPNGLLGAYCYAKDGNPDLYLRNMVSGSERRLTFQEGIDTSPSWSPDGRRLVFVSDRHGGPQLFIMDIETGSVSRLTYEGSYNVEPVWSPDGDKIAYTSLVDGVNQIAVISLSDRRVTTLTDRERISQSPSWSPNGRYIIFSSTRSGHSELYRLNVSTGTVSRVTYTKNGAFNPVWSFFSQ